MSIRLSALWLLLVTTGAAAQGQVIHAGAVIDGVSAQPRAQQSIRIVDNRIVAIDAGYVDPAGAELIDLREYTVLPGLMDMHVHLDLEFDKSYYLKRFALNATDRAILATEHARRTLLAGFTTVRNPGDSYNSTIALRNAVNRGLVPGPRIYSAGKSIATTGGHADPSNGYRKDLMGDPGPQQGVINGPQEAWEAVRQHYKDGADFLKLTVTGGVLSVAKSGENPQFTDAELQAIMAAAKDYNLHVAVHAHGVEGMKRAIRAGVHSVEHGTYMDKAAMKLMKKQGTWYVPTITAGRWVADKAAEEGYYPELVRPKAAAIGPLIQQTFGRAYRYGVRIAFGTDAGVFPHGLNAREFGYMVEAGMPAMAAIQSATLNTAKLLGVEAELGSIQPGKLADIIAVRGDPLERIQLLEEVAFVMKDGRVYKAP